MTTARAAARALCALLVACAVIVALVRSGSTYFFCFAMQASSVSPCCVHGGASGGRAESAAPPHEGEPAIDARACCEARTAEALPDGSGAAAPHVPDAPLTAIAQGAHRALTHPTPRALPRDLAPGSPRAPPGRAREARARLGVYLI